MGEQENRSSESDTAAAAKEDGADPRLRGISDAIRVVPHFPKQGPSVCSPVSVTLLCSDLVVRAHAPAGIMFNDITALLLRPGVFKDAVDMFVERYRGMGIAAVAGTVVIKSIHPLINHAHDTSSPCARVHPHTKTRPRVRSAAGPYVFL